MSFIRKYGFVLALAVAVIYVYLPLTRDDIAKLRWLDDINVIISKVLAPANREVRVVSVDRLPQRMSTRISTTESPSG